MTVVIMNMYKIIGNAKELTNEQWKALRVIGGSTVGAIMGFSYYDSPYTVWERLTNNEESEDIDNKHIRFGNLIEPVLREWFREEIRLEYGNEVEVLENDEVMQSTLYPYLTGNIDGDIILPELGKGVVEIKTAGANAKAFRDDEIPDNYYCQIQYYMWLTDRQYGYMVWLKDKELGYQFIERNDMFIDNMIETVREFWEEYVVNEIPPPFSGVESEEEIIKSKYGVSDPSKVITMPELETTLEALLSIKEEIKGLEQSKTALENQIKFVMGDAEICIIGDRQVTWKTSKNGRRMFKA